MTKCLVELPFQFTSCRFDGMAGVSGPYPHLKLQKQFMKLEFAPVMVLYKIETSSTGSGDCCVF